VFTDKELGRYGGPIADSCTPANASFDHTIDDAGIRVLGFSVARLTHALTTELRLELTGMLLGAPRKAAPSITNAGLESTTLLQMCASIASRSGGGGGRPAPVMGITARSARDFRDMVQSFRSRGPSLSSEGATQQRKDELTRHRTDDQQGPNSITEGRDSPLRKLSKKRSTGRIDGMIALAMAIGVAPLRQRKIDITTLIA
jgi:hypothetical protein